MSISKFINRNLSTFSRNQRKKEVINRVLNTEQTNNGVINVHRIDPNNAGDFYCAPHHYFKELKNKELDIFDYKSNDKFEIQNWIDKISNKSLVIGGGGLLNRSSFEQQMRLFEHLNDKGKKTVLWGVGHNEKDGSTFNNLKAYNIDVKKFGLVGTRDYSVANEWVPCVSCMHEIFDSPYIETQEIGIIYHKKTLKNKALLKKLKTYPSTSNTTDLEEIISFIKKSKTVVTDSYHAMYWSMLLGKKVVVVPNSSKFYDFKYKPAFSTFHNFEIQIKEAPSFSGLLEEYREINLQFSEKVFNYLNL